MTAESLSLLLPGRGEDVANKQLANGRLALDDAQREELDSLYEESVEDVSDDAEAIRLLTRPFSRKEEIPEYYRYCNAHVYDWFLSHYPDDPVGTAVLALRVTLLDLVATEQAEYDRHDEPPPHLTERLDRLAGLLDQLDAVPIDPAGTVLARDLVDRTSADETLRWRLFLLAKCTDFPQSDDHNEHVFLRAVHACEVGFYLVRWIACRTVIAIDGREPDAAARLAQLVDYTELLRGVFHMLGTLSPDQFMNFREATGAASAVQSLNFHLMEISVYGYDPRKTEVFERFAHLGELSLPPFRDSRSLRDAVLAADDEELAEGFARVDRSLLSWRGKHYSFGRRYLPREIEGSGGTEGASYLKRFVHKDVCLPGTSVTVDDRLLRFALR